MKSQLMRAAFTIFILLGSMIPKVGCGNDEPVLIIEFPENYLLDNFVAFAKGKTDEELALDFIRDEWKQGVRMKAAFAVEKLNPEAKDLWQARKKFHEGLAALRNKTKSGADFDAMVLIEAAIFKSAQQNLKRCILDKPNDSLVEYAQLGDEVDRQKKISGSLHNRYRHLTTTALLVEGKGSLKLLPQCDALDEISKEDLKPSQFLDNEIRRLLLPK